MSLSGETKKQPELKLNLIVVIIVAKVAKRPNLERFAAQHNTLNTNCFWSVYYHICFVY